MTSLALYGLYAIFALGAAGLCMCLPTTQPGAARLRWAGAVLVAAALAGMAVYVARWIGSGVEGRPFFLVFAVTAVAAAVRVVTHRRPVYSAVYFVVVVLAVAGLCVLAAAEFLAAALVIVYGGAILVTYVFVIMLAQQTGEAVYDVRAREPFAAVAMGFVLVAAATQAMVSTDGNVADADRPVHSAIGGISAPPLTAPVSADPQSPNAVQDPASINSEAGNTRDVGRELMKTYMLAVQLAGLLMLVAMVGAIVIAGKRIDPEHLTPQERGRPHDEPGRLGREAKPF